MELEGEREGVVLLGSGKVANVLESVVRELVMMCVKS